MTASPEPIAHSTNDHGEPHLLETHLVDVSELAGVFGDRFGSGDSCRISGLWHDIGKAHPGFQAYLRAQEQGRDASSPPHSIWGAALLHQLAGNDSAFREIGLPIAGHHAGLKEPSLVIQEVRSVIDSEPEVLEIVKEQATALSTPTITVPSVANPVHRAVRARMVLSALVDADRLDTEAHFEPTTASERDSGPSLQELWDSFETDQSRLIQDADRTEINDVRREVYEACLGAAADGPGLFRLTVPTGGGKTRSSLGFGLKHALEHDQERIIVAIPYTSIIDQTAKTYRQILGREAVLEHHSSVTSDDDQETRSDVGMWLATQNWDAPIIVTTTVQLFESLFSHHPGQVRKVHRIANSVVVLDEVQTLPVGLLEPAMDMLRELVEEYGTTVVLCTATQPALQNTPLVEQFDGDGGTEIVPHFRDHFETLKRVRYEQIPEPISWRDLGSQLSNHDQVLAILNTRHDALSLLKELPSGDDLVHLSTLLCQAHRRDKLNDIHERLADDRPIRVISTQVVEAGVDIDFPAVYRAIGPMDRVVQAAGRCNREGELDEGTVYIFEPAEGGAPSGPYRHGIGLTRQLLEEPDAPRPGDPEIFDRYFGQLFEEQDLDAKDIQQKRERMDFREVSRSFNLIDQDTVPIVVDYKENGHEGQGPKLANQLIETPSRQNWMGLQQYTVSVYRHELQNYIEDGWVTPLGEELYRWKGQYNDHYGLVEGLRDPTDLIRNP